MMKMKPINFCSQHQGDRNEVLYQLVLATGLRQSEVLGLKWSDLDIEKSTITVQRQLKRNRQKGKLF